MIIRFLKREIGLADAEVLDLDEEKYRGDEWAVRLYASARTPFEPAYLQAAKLIIAEERDDDAKADIAAQLSKDIAASGQTFFLLGPGSTVQSIAVTFGIDKTLLGIDDGRLIGKDLNEREMLTLLDQYPERKLVLSPIGAQGFVLGRGNQQLSPAIIKRVEARIVVATPAKLARTPVCISTLAIQCSTKNWLRANSSLSPLALAARAWSEWRPDYFPGRGSTDGGPTPD